MRQTAPLQAASERRRKPRIAQPFPLQVVTRNGQGEEIHLRTVVGNLSASGLYVEVEAELKVGQRVGLMIRMARNGEAAEEEAAVVAAEAVVVRCQAMGKECWGVGMSLLHRRVV
jgi:hypothetical protein